MTIIHTEELRDMTPAERASELADLKTELLNARAVKAAGGAPENPARIGELRKAIARIKTIQNEEGDDVEDVEPTPVSEVETPEPAGSPEPDDLDEDETTGDESVETDDAEEDVTETDLLGGEDDDNGDDAGEDA